MSVGFRHHNVKFVSATPISAGKYGSRMRVTWMEEDGAMRVANTVSGTMATVAAQKMAVGTVMDVIRNKQGQVTAFNIVPSF